MTPPERTCPRCAAPLGDARFCPACGFAASRLEPGEVLDGKYEILDKIGEGGMGEVYRARHLHLDEIRIIKVTKPDVAGDPGSARRFQEEARLAAAVRHPNVAALYDFSRRPDGSFYMVWEFIDGITLEQWLRRHGRLPPARALDVARQVLAGLSEIHAQGIVHRDVSPDNIMVREAPGGRLQAKIIDLGIAKRVAAESLQMTGTGFFLGKLKYCSPEQAGALPVGQALDARTDVYSFGAVLYEMLTGAAPFESSTPEGYLGKHLHAPAPPLDVSGLPRGLGPPLAAIVARTLEKKRERRYATASELASALEQLAPAAEELAATVAAPAAPPSRAEGPGRRLAAIAAVVLAAAAVTLLLRGRRTPSAAAPAPARPPAPATARPQSTATASPPAEPTAPPAPTAAAPATPVGGAPPPAPGAPLEATATETVEEARRLTPAAMRQILAIWRSSPDESRARRAPEVARTANRFVTTHPAAPLTLEIEATLPAYLKQQATGALDHAQPLLAVLYFRAYRHLRFAPADPDLERRFEGLPPEPTPVPGRRATPGDADGR